MSCCLELLSPFLILGVLIYVGVPLIVKFTLRLSSAFSIMPMEPNMMTPQATGYFGRVASSIATHGFVAAGYYHLSGMSSGSDAMLALWISRHSGEIAISAVTTFRPGGRHELMQRSQYTQYLVRLTDGTSVVTSNSPRLSAFRPAGTRSVIHAPGIDSPAVLYRLHEAHAGAMIPPDAARVLPDPGGEIEWLETLISEEIQTQVATGNFQPAVGGEHVPTWKGAFVLTYDQLPPMKQMRRTHEEARARPFADAAGVTL